MKAVLLLLLFLLGLGKTTDRKAIVKNADMPEEMQQDAIECATQALEKFYLEKDIAAFIKKEFDKKYNPSWNCIVGKNLGSYVDHEPEHFIYFYMGQIAILMFKSDSNGARNEVGVGAMNVAHEVDMLVGEIKRLGQENADGKYSVTFGEMFHDTRCANIFEALVGTLRAAKRKKVITYEGELLLQGVHDNVQIVLLKEDYVNAELSVGSGGLTLYFSTVSSNMGIKKHQQKIAMILDARKIAYEVVDISSNSDAKEKMRQISGNPKALPPQIANGDQYCGDYNAFENAVEYEELSEFLKLDANGSELSVGSDGNVVADIKILALAGAFAAIGYGVGKYFSKSDSVSYAKLTELV